MKTKSKQIHILIAVLVFLVFRLILGNCLDMGLTAAGASALSLFIATIYLWITYGSGWTSMLSIGLLAFTGIAPANTILGNSFGNSTAVIVIGTLILCVALEENGVTKLIANWFISRSIVSKRPYMFLFMFLLANLFITYFMEATAVAIIFWALAKSILDSLGYTKEDRFSKSLYLGVLWVTCVGNAATPIGHPVPLLMLNSMAKITEQPVSWLRYMAIGIPLSLVTLGLTLLIIRFVIKPDCAKFDAYDVGERRKELQPLSAKGKISLTVYIALIVFWLLPDFLGPFPELAAKFKAVGASVPSLIAVAVVCAITVDGEPVLKYESAIKKIHWSTVIFIACIFLYASVFSMESGGINVFLKALVAPLTDSLSAGVLAAVFLFLVIFATNFVSNGVTGIVGITVCVPALLSISSVGYVTAYGVLVAMLCNMGIATPGGSGFVALAQKDGVVTGSETMKYSLLLILMMYLSVMLIFWPMAQLLFR